MEKHFYHEGAGDNIPSNIKELYVTRLIVLLEDQPQSNTYRQIQLSPEEFKKVSNAIGDVVRKENPVTHIETVQVDLSKRLYRLPDIQEIYYEKH